MEACLRGRGLQSSVMFCRQYTSYACRHSVAQGPDPSSFRWVQMFFDAVLNSIAPPAARLIVKAWKCCYDVLASFRKETWRDGVTCCDGPNCPGDRPSTRRFQMDLPEDYTKGESEPRKWCVWTEATTPHKYNSTSISIPVLQRTTFLSIEVGYSTLSRFASSG